VLGPGSPQHLRDSVAALGQPPPAELWTELIDSGLLRADTPVPIVVS
jgi:hypothetical protein